MADGDEERSTVNDRPDTTPDAPQASESSSRPRRGVQRRTLLIMLAAIVVVALVVALPAFISSRPSYFDRYPELDTAYGTWSESTHAEVDCEECHVPPNELARVGYRLLMVGQVYTSVFRPAPPDVFRTPTNEACLACHNDLRTVSPEGDLQIPHRAHVTILEMECVECHNFLVHEESPSGGHTPEMEDCLECHDGDRARDNCTACHTEKAAPATHADKNWLVVHPDDADNPECAECHDWSGNWCVQCHESRPASHGNDWRATHGANVDAHRNCEACHVGDFCITCHGVVPQLNFDPNLNLVE